MEDQLMAICSMSNDTESDAIVMPIERNATKFDEIVDAIREKWEQLSSRNLVVKYSVPDQSMGACLVTLANNRDVVNMYDLHKNFKANIVRMSVMANELIEVEPRADIISRSTKLDLTEVNEMSFFKPMTGDFSQGLRLPKKIFNKRGSLKRDRRDNQLKNATGKSRGKAIKLASSSSSDEINDTSSLAPQSSPEDNKAAVNEDPSGSSSRSATPVRNTRSSRYSKRRRGPIRGSKQRTEEEYLGNHTSKTHTLAPHHPNIYVGQTLLDEEHKRALKLADDVHSDKPCFLLVMRQSMVKRIYFVCVPLGFRAQYLHSPRCDVFLQVPGNQMKWTVNYVAFQSRMGLSRGWRVFSIDNNLQTGDICLFELMTTNEETVITVHINRRAE